MYRDALCVLERNFGPPQTVVSAHIKIFTSVQPVKVHTSESIISFSCVISSLVCELGSFSHKKNLEKTANLNQAFKLVGVLVFVSSQCNCYRPSHLEFIDW